MTVTVYSKNNCVQCTATKRLLDKTGIDYTEVNIETDAAAYAFVKELGFQAAPVVMIDGTEDAWSGFIPERITALAA